MDGGGQKSNVLLAHSAGLTKEVRGQSTSLERSADDTAQTQKSVIEDAVVDEIWTWESVHENTSGLVNAH